MAWSRQGSFVGLLTRAKLQRTFYWWRSCETSRLGTADVGNISNPPIVDGGMAMPCVDRALSTLRWTGGRHFVPVPCESHQPYGRQQFSPVPCWPRNACTKWATAGSVNWRRIHSGTSNASNSNGKDARIGQTFRDGKERAGAIHRSAAFINEYKDGIVCSR